MVRNEGVERGEKLYRHRFVAGLIKVLVEDFIENSKAEVDKYRKKMPLSALLDADTPLPVGFSKEIGRELKALKKVMYQKLYRHEKIVSKMYAGKQCIQALYGAFTEDEGLLPPHHRELLETRPKQRVVADYIASMTDRSAMKSYHGLYGLTL
jgi:dGTPase